MPLLESATLDLALGHHTVLCELLERHVPDAEVWAFGSRVNGGAHEGSDLDLVLRNACESGTRVEGADDLREALQMSALPILVDVHEWAQLPMAFRREIERRRLVIRSPHPGQADLR